MKKTTKIAAVFIAVIGCALALFMYSEHKEKMLNEQLELETLYEDGLSVVSNDESDYSGILESADKIIVDDAQLELSFVDSDLFNGYSEVTFADFIDIYQGASEFDCDTPTSDDIECSLIDCGNDGHKECCIRIPFTGDGVYYEVICVIDNRDNNFYLKYMADEGQRDYVTIDENGYVIKETGTGFGTSTEYSILNADCEKQFFYSMNYYLKAEDYKKINVQGEEWDNIQINEYCMSNNETYCSYFELDENFNMINENDEKYLSAFEQAGVNVLPQSEIQDKLTALEAALK